MAALAPPRHAAIARGASGFPLHLGYTLSVVSSSAVPTPPTDMFHVGISLGQRFRAVPFLERQPCRLEALLRLIDALHAAERRAGNRDGDVPQPDGACARWRSGCGQCTGRLRDGGCHSRSARSGVFVGLRFYGKVEEQQPDHRKDQDGEPERDGKQG